MRTSGILFLVYCLLFAAQAGAEEPPKPWNDRDLVNRVSTLDSGKELSQVRGKTFAVSFVKAGNTWKVAIQGGTGMRTYNLTESLSLQFEIDYAKPIVISTPRDAAPTNLFVGTWLRQEGEKVVDVITIQPHPDGVELIFRETESGPVYSQGTGQVQGETLSAASFSVTRVPGVTLKMRMLDRDHLTYSSFNADGSARWSGDFFRKK